MADPLIVHPDIRRMLMTIRAFNEAARALLLATILDADVARRLADQGDAATIAAADDRLGLMTPVDEGRVHRYAASTIACWPSRCWAAMATWPNGGLEQFVRDARIAMIYEGANGIQALDLVGRKLPKDGGRAFMRLHEATSPEALGRRCRTPTR